MSYNAAREYLIQAMSYAQDYQISGDKKALAAKIVTALSKASRSDPKWFNQQVLAYDEAARIDYLAVQASAIGPRLKDISSANGRLQALGEGVVVDELDNEQVRPLNEQRTMDIEKLNDQNSDGNLVEKFDTDLPGDEDTAPEDQPIDLDIESAVENVEEARRKRHEKKHHVRKKHTHEEVEEPLEMRMDTLADVEQAIPGVAEEREDPEAQHEGNDSAVDDPEYEGADDLADIQQTVDPTDLNGTQVISNNSFSPEELLIFDELDRQDAESERSYLGDSTDNDILNTENIEIDSSVPDAKVLKAKVNKNLAYLGQEDDANNDNHVMNEGHDNELLHENGATEVSRLNRNKLALADTVDELDTQYGPTEFQSTQELVEPYGNLNLPNPVHEDRVKDDAGSQVEEQKNQPKSDMATTEEALLKDEARQSLENADKQLRATHRHAVMTGYHGAMRAPHSNAIHPALEQHVSKLRKGHKARKHLEAYQKHLKHYEEQTGDTNHSKIKITVPKKVRHASVEESVTKEQFERWDSRRQHQWLKDHPESEFHKHNQNALPVYLTGSAKSVKLHHNLACLG